MDREQLLKLGQAMQADPSRAPAIARLMLSQIPDEAGLAPGGYVYHGAHKLVSRVQALPVPSLEPVDPPVLSAGGAVPSDPIKVPFDCIIFGVGGRAAPVPNTTDADTLPFQATIAQGAEDGRDMFAVNWKIDGLEGFFTDGRDELLAPACIATGTQQNPRAMYWEVQRNQRIVVRYKSLLSLQYGPAELIPSEVLPPIDAEVIFYALNVEAP